MNPILRGWPAAQCWALILIANALALFMGLAYLLVGALTWRGPDSTIGDSARPMAAGEHGVASTVGDSVGAWLVHRLLQESGEPFFALLMLMVALLSGLVVLLGVLQARARHAERTVLRQLAAARETNARKTSHMATVAHELRTPLNGLSGFSELIEISDDLEEAKRYARFIHSSSLHLQGLLNNILDLSKIRAGRTTARLRPCQPAVLLEHAASMFSMIALRKGLVLKVRCPESLDVSLYTDPDLLERALVNLVSNAVKYTEKGNVICELRKDAEGWHFMVQDTGRGIDPLDLKRIFEPFNSLNDERFATPEQGSSGLGLALTHEVAELLGGRLSVASELGQGSTFTLILPDRHPPQGC